jgi:hypothetical protein
MKKLTAIFLVAVLLVSMSIPVFAEPAGTVGKFTPEIDGEKDAAYSESFSFNIFAQDETNKGEGWWSTHGNQSTDVDANVSFLWDDQFLYAYVDVIQSEVLNIGDSHILEHDNPWEANSIELWIIWGDLDFSDERLKTSVEPLHNRTWGDAPGGVPGGLSFEDVESGTQKIAKLTPTGYSGEFAIAIPAAYLKEGGQFKFTLQVNVWDGEGSIPVGRQLQGNIDNVAVLTLGEAIAVAVEPEPEPEEEPAVEEVDLGTGGGEAEAAPVIAPPTGDNIIFIIAGFAALILTAAVVIRKQKRIFVK